MGEFLSRLLSAYLDQYGLAVRLLVIATFVLFALWLNRKNIFRNPAEEREPEEKEFIEELERKREENLRSQG